MSTSLWTIAVYAMLAAIVGALWLATVRLDPRE